MTDIADIPTGFTPGPWFHDNGVVYIDTRQQVCCGRGTVSGECCGNPDVTGDYEKIADTSLRDGPLIAAAPAMAEEIKRLRDENERLKLKADQWQSLKDAVYDGLDNSERLHRQADDLRGQVMRLEGEKARLTESYDDLRALNAELVEGLKEAREDVSSWASHASNYFKEKWDLEADLARIDALISRAEGR